MADGQYTHVLKNRQGYNIIFTAFSDPACMIMHSMVSQLVLRITYI